MLTRDTFTGPWAGLPVSWTDGKLFDADREGRVNANWESLAQVKAEKGADFWRVTVSIPVVTPEKNEGDPFHYVVGAKPSRDALWHFNVGRTRVRNGQRASQTFLPTGGIYHVREKFAKLAIE